MSFTHCWKQPLHEFIVISRKTTALGCVLFEHFKFTPGYTCAACFVGPCPTGTMGLDPTFGSFTLLEQVSHEANWFLW